MARRPRVITKDIKKFKFALRTEVVNSLAEYADREGYPNLSEALESLLIRTVG